MQISDMTSFKCNSYIVTFVSCIFMSQVVFGEYNIHYSIKLSWATVVQFLSLNGDSPSPGRLSSLLAGHRTNLQLKGGGMICLERCKLLV